MKASLLTLWVGGVLACGLLLQTARTDGPAPARVPASAELLRTLVTQSLRMADEDDPLRRLEVCSDVADSLTRAIADASARGDTQEAVRLGDYLGKVLGRGMRPNLARVDPEAMAAGRQGELEQVATQLTRLDAALEHRGPEPCPPSLKQVLDHSRRGLQEMWHHAKLKFEKGNFGKHGEGKHGKGKHGEGKHGDGPNTKGQGKPSLRDVFNHLFKRKESGKARPRDMEEDFFGDQFEAPAGPKGTTKPGKGGPPERRPGDRDRRRQSDRKSEAPQIGFPSGKRTGRWPFQRRDWGRPSEKSSSRY